MKRFPLLPLLPQVALVFAVAYACSDTTTAPANSHALVAPTGIAGDVGKPPPPPVSTVISVSIQSPEHAFFTGVFFNNGNIHDDGVGLTETFDGTAWLRFDNKQPDLGGTATANTRFMARDMNFSGMGTLSFGGVEFKIVSVQSFTRFAACGAPEPGFPPSPCASIDFRATDEFEVEHTGHAEAFDRASCLVDNGEGGFRFVCGSID